MLNRDEVINDFEICYSTGHNCTECSLFYKDDCNDKLIQDVVTLLKEHENKPVDPTFSHNLPLFPYCGACGKLLVGIPGDVKSKIKYCWNCGRAVRWND